jgi:hypothetical protein
MPSARSALFRLSFPVFHRLPPGAAAETGLIAYLWPLFIVLFSGLLPGERLRAPHVLGALIAFAGAALIVLGGGAGDGRRRRLDWRWPFLCRDLGRLFGAVAAAGRRADRKRDGLLPCHRGPVGGWSHLALEETVWPQGRPGWLAVLALGLGPVGAAFFTWDIGMKRGDIQLSGRGLLCGAAFVDAGTGGRRDRGSGRLATGLAAAVLIAGGAALAARASGRQVRLRKRRDFFLELQFLLLPFGDLKVIRSRGCAARFPPSSER